MGLENQTNAIEPAILAREVISSIADNNLCKGSGIKPVNKLRAKIGGALLLLKCQRLVLSMNFPNIFK